MTTPRPDPQRTKTITQGHPTYAEPGVNKGGQNGAPQPNDRRRKSGNGLPPTRVEAWTRPDDPSGR